MKRSSFLFPSIRTAILASFVGICLTASGSGSAGSVPGTPQQDVESQASAKAAYDNMNTFEKSSFEEKALPLSAAISTKNAEAELKANQAQLRDALQKQMNALLLENAEINRKRIELLESDKKKAFWTQSLVIFLIVAIVVALFSFWRLHAARVINNSLAALSDTLSNFQDSFFNLVDTTQLASNSSVSSFQIQTELPSAETALDHDLDLQKKTRREFARQKTTNIASDYFVEELSSTSEFGAAVNAQIEADALHDAALESQQILETKVQSTSTPKPSPDEFFAVKGYVDSWLRVYKPSDAAEEQDSKNTEQAPALLEKQLPYAAAIAARKAVAAKPESPRSMLARLDSCRANNDADGYEKVYKEIKKLFNLKLEPWEMLGEVEQKQLSDFPHVVNKVLELWQTNDIVIYLERLLSNSRINPREGFDLAIYQKLEDLLELARADDRPRDLQQLKKLERAAFLFAPMQVTKAGTSGMTNAARGPSATDYKPKKAEPALKIDSSLSYGHSKEKYKNLEAMITPEAGALDNPSDTAPLVPNLPTSRPTTIEANKPSEDKFLLSPFEVRIKLAVAYTEMGDSEGAILLLEEVIHDAPPSQRKHAERLLKEIQDKKVRLENNLANGLSNSTTQIEA